MNAIQLTQPGSACRVSGELADNAPGVCIAGNNAPVHEVPLWGPRIAVDGAALELHQPSGFTVDLCLSRHLITYWLESNRGSRAIDSDCLKPVRFEQGSFNLTPAGSRLKAISEQPTRALLFSVDPQFLQRVLPEPVAAQSGLLPPLQGVTVPAMQHLAELARGLLSGNATPDRLYFESLLVLVLMEALTRIQSPAGLESALPKHPGASRRMHRVRDYILDNIDQPLSLTELAAVASLSMYQFARCFRRCFGQSPHQYVLQERVKKSKQLLNQPQYSIAEVALLCGFSHQAHLALVFKKFQGVTPSEFRKHRFN
jgi:AraC family transcriptional regulator